MFQTLVAYHGAAEMEAVKTPGVGARVHRRRVVFSTPGLCVASINGPQLRHLHRQ